MILGVFDPANPLTWIGAGGIATAVLATIGVFIRGLVIPGHIYEQALETIRARDETILAKDATIASLHQLVEDRAMEVLLKANTNLENVSEFLKELAIRERIERERRR